MYILLVDWPTATLTFKQVNLLQNDLKTKLFFIMIVRTDRTVLTYNNLHYILCLELASLDFIIYPTKKRSQKYMYKLKTLWSKKLNETCIPPEMYIFALGAFFFFDIFLFYQQCMYND